MRQASEAYHVPPWLIHSTLSIPALYALFYNEGSGLTKCASHEEAVARANAIRKKRGLPPLSTLPPGGKRLVPALGPPKELRPQGPHPGASKPTAPPPRFTGVPEDPTGPFPEFKASKKEQGPPLNTEKAKKPPSEARQKAMEQQRPRQQEP